MMVASGAHHGAHRDILVAWECWDVSAARVARCRGEGFCGCRNACSLSTLLATVDGPHYLAGSQACWPHAVSVPVCSLRCLLTATAML